MLVNSVEFIGIRRNIAPRNCCEAGLSLSFNYVVNRRIHRRNVLNVSLVSFFAATHVGSTSVSDKFQRIAFLCVAYSRLYK
jgi:hypothetical protein